MAKSIPGQSSMFDLTTCEDSSSVISSPGSGDGPMRCDSPDGQTNGTAGRSPVLVSGFRVRLEAERLQRICGRSSGASSMQIALASSLANRWRRRVPGLIDCALTWQPWDTKSGRRFCRLAASASIMRALGLSLSATPTATANQSCPSMQKWIGCRGVEVTPAAFCRRMGFPIAWLNLPRLETPSSQESERK